MKTRLLISYALTMCFLFLTHFSISAQQGCSYDYTLRCPARYQGCIDESPGSSNTGFPTILRTGVLCDSVQFSYSDQILVDNDCNLLFDRLWSATIPGSNTTRKCSQRIELFDNTSPSISSCPPDIRITLPDSTASWVDPQITDNCGTVNISYSHQNGSFFSLGTTEVILTATDGCGNQSSCSFTVTLEEGCTTEFELICPSDFVSCIVTDIDPSVIGSANTIHEGDFCGTKSIGYSDNALTDQDCNTIIERTWTATADETNETKQCVQRIEISDTLAPLISNCPPDITVETLSTPVNWLDPQVNDNCSSIQLSSNFNSGSIFPEGQTEVIYTAKDDCGNSSTCSFFVNVTVDTCDQDFTIICPSNFYGCIGDSTDPYDTGQANVSHSGDFCGSLSISYEDSTLSQTSSRVEIQRVWYATIQDDGTKKGCAQLIILEDNEAPIINNCPDDISLEPEDATYTWTLPTASDNCTSVTLESTHDNGSTFPEGETTVTYTATDDNGNSSTCSFIITVKTEECNEDFDIICPTDYTDCRDGSTDPTETGRPSITHHGQVCGSISVTSDDRIISESDCSLVIEREWTATSQGGLKKRCIQRIRLEDKDAPTIHNCPDDVVLDFDEAQYTWTLPTASDNCSTITLESSHPNGSTFPVGTTIVKYTATDDCGNKSTCSFEIKVKPDNTGSNLIVQCPDDIVIDCGGELHYDSWPLPEVASTCGNCDEDHSADYVDMGSIDGHRYYCSKFKATWQDAAEHARRMGGYLVIINDEYENKLLSEFLEVRSAYIGLSDHVEEGEFKWVDGSGVTYSNWYPGQPNDYRGKQDYVELLNDGYWNDQYSYKKLEFIVELPCIKVEQIEGPLSPSAFTGTSAKITYKVSDGCGNNKTCSFTVSKSGSLNLTCPQDIEVNLHSGQHSKEVTWDDPAVETCCSYSGGYGEINGFVYMGHLNGHHYYCSKEDLKWKDAQAVCESHGGYLAVINSEEENTMLANFLTVQSAFIGLSDHNHEGHFEWVNGASLDYTNWYPGQPNNYYDDQHYVEMLNNGQWNDQYSHKKREYIMEIPGGVELTQISGPAKGSSLEAGTYDIKYKAKDACGNIDFCSFKVMVNGSGSNDFCHTGPTDSYGNWIESAQFGEYKNVTGNDGGYGDYSSNCVSVTKNKVIDIQLTAGSHSYTNTLYWAIFVDWNKDGNYSKSERIARGRSKIALKGRFIFSNSLPTGNFPMRISANTYGYHENGCDPIGYGEVEDYCLTVRDEHGYFTSKPSTKANIEMEEVVMNSFDLINEKEEDDVSLEKLASTKIFPNPFVNNFEIQGSAFNTLSVWQLDGKLLKTVKIENTSRYNLDMSDLPSGAYLLEIGLSDGSIDMKRIIKR